MVSVDHFHYELHRHLNNAEALGVASILISAKDIHRSAGGRSDEMEACIEALERELKSGDEVVVPGDSPEGMTVRYVLPRLV